MLETIFLLQQPGAEASPVAQFLPLILIGVVFYFFIIRPQTKKAKDAKKFRESIKKGDKVITIGGIHGKIVEIRESNLILEIEGGNRLKVEKSAVSLELTTGNGESSLQQGNAGK